MVLYSNIALEAETTFVYEGSRLLEIHNNTTLEGKKLPDVFVFFEKRNRKSIVSISDLDETKGTPDFVFGLFVGSDFKATKGCRFEGQTKTKDGIVKLGIFNPDGEIEVNGKRLVIVQGLGWLEKSAEAI